MCKYIWGPFNVKYSKSGSKKNNFKKWSAHVALGRPISKAANSRGNSTESIVIHKIHRALQLFNKGHILPSSSYVYVGRISEYSNYGPYRCVCVLHIGHTS